MSKISKILLLATCAGVCFVIVTELFWLLRSSINPNQLFSEINIWRRTKDVFGFLLLGFIPCLIFGTPCLLIIDKYFSRYRTRYITGGFVAGWIAWFFMVGPLLTTSPWLSVNSWIDSGINYIGLYVWMGFSTGLLFTALLWICERLKRKP